MILVSLDVGFALMNSLAALYISLNNGGCVQSHVELNQRQELCCGGSGAYTLSQLVRTVILPLLDAPISDIDKFEIAFWSILALLL